MAELDPEIRLELAAMRWLAAGRLERARGVRDLAGALEAGRTLLLGASYARLVRAAEAALVSPPMSHERDEAAEELRQALTAHCATQTGGYPYQRRATNDVRRPRQIRMSMAGGAAAGWGSAKVGKEAAAGEHLEQELIL